MTVRGYGRVDAMGVSPESRKLFEQKYGIKASEQVAIESIIEKRELHCIPDKFMEKVCAVDGIDWGVCKRMYRDCCDKYIARPDPSPVDTCKDYTRDNDEDTLVVTVDGTPSHVNKDYLPYDRLRAIKTSCSESARIRRRWNNYQKLVRRRRKRVAHKLKHARMVRTLHMIPVYAVLFILSAISPVLPKAAYDQCIWPSIEQAEWIVPSVLGGVAHMLGLAKFVMRFLGALSQSMVVDDPVPRM